MNMTVKGLSFKPQRHDKVILHDICAQFGTGMTLVLGKNGSGKSTFFDCLAGINRDYTGEVAGNEGLVYLNQHTYFNGRLKAKDFVSFTLTLDGVKKPHAYFDAFIRTHGFADFFRGKLERPFGMLSGGERRMTVMAAILSLQRKWYILDEPFAGVDKDGKAAIIALTAQIAAQGRGVILSDHDSGVEDMFPGARKLYMEDGRLA